MKDARLIELGERHCMLLVAVLNVGPLWQCLSIAGPRPDTGPSSYRKKYLPDRGMTKVENQCSMVVINCYDYCLITVVTEFRKE
jgi:hypothetical protein